MKLFLISLCLLFGFSSSAWADNSYLLNQQLLIQAKQGNLQAMSRLFVAMMNSEKSADWEKAYVWGRAMIAKGYPQSKHFNQAWLNNTFNHLLGPKTFKLAQKKSKEFINSLNKIVPNR